MSPRTTRTDRTLVIDALIFKQGKAYGYQEYLFNLLDYFSEHKGAFCFKRIILAVSQSQMCQFEKYGQVFELCGLSAERKISHLFFQNMLERRLELKKSDVLLFTYNYSSLFKHCQHVLVVHDLLYLRKSYLPNRLMRWQRQLFMPTSLRNADKIIAISNFTKKDILTHYKIASEKINIIYNYFNFEKYVPTENYFKCEKPYFVSICSNAYHKNTVSVLKAFSEFCKQDETHDIVFIGSLTDKNSKAFAEYETLQENVKKRIHILSHISNEELGMIYRNAGCFISLTLFEGLGMPIVEAMYFNLPMILSDLEVCREIADGAEVQFVSPFDIEQIAQAMRGVKNTETSKNSALLVQKRFSQERTSEKYIEVLNS